MTLKIIHTGALDRFFGVKTQIDLSKAQSSDALSHVGLDEETRTFEATIDKVLFKSPIEVVTTVLEANGFLLNLENFLSCLDQMQIGVRARMAAKDLDGHLPQPKAFAPAIQFALPQKTKVGPLLSRFYQEIELYETQLAARAPKTKNGKGETAEELREEIKKLRSENRDLQGRVDELARKLNEALRNHTAVARALESQNLLPDHMRLATVREILLEERQVVLRSGRKTLNVPLALLNRLPALDEQCITVLDDDGAVKHAFFYGEEGQSFTPKVAEVLYVQKDRIKFRDAERHIWLVAAMNDVERGIIKQLKRGQRALLYLLGGQLIRFEPCATVKEEVFEQMVQESISIQQIRQFWQDVQRARRRGA